MSSDGTLSTASWYRFDGAAGNRMSEYAPGYNQKCGTQTGGWLSTPHPSVGAGPTAGEANLSSAMGLFWVGLATRGSPLRPDQSSDSWPTYSSEQPNELHLSAGSPPPYKLEEGRDAAYCAFWAEDSPYGH